MLVVLFCLNNDLVLHQWIDQYTLRHFDAFLLGFVQYHECLKALFGPGEQMLIIKTVERKFKGSLRMLWSVRREGTKNQRCNIFRRRNFYMHSAIVSSIVLAETESMFGTCNRGLFLMKRNWPQRAVRPAKSLGFWRDDFQRRREEVTNCLDFCRVDTEEGTANEKQLRSMRKRRTTVFQTWFMTIGEIFFVRKTKIKSDTRWCPIVWRHLS